jgi:hypothetical protein
MLMQKGVCNIRIWPRGVDLNLFGPHRRRSTVRQAWGVRPSLGRCDQGANHQVYPLTPPPSPTLLECNYRSRSEQCVILYVGRL